MRHGKLLRVGGFLSGGVLILFGVAVIALGIWAFAFATWRRRATTRVAAADPELIHAQRREVDRRYRGRATPPRG